MLSNDKERSDYDMRMFGRSSGINRFDTGEYTLRKEHSHGMLLQGLFYYLTKFEVKRAL